MPKARKTFLIGAFSFDAESEILTSADGTQVALRPQTARVLGLLAANHDELVTKDALMGTVWADTHVTDDSLVQCISEIRRALGARDAKLLATIPKQGYRLSAVAAHDTDAPSGPETGTKLGRTRHFGRRWIAALVAVSGLLLLAVAGSGFLLSRDVSPNEPIIIAVLPFENLSGDPEQDYLSVGLAEDLLTDLSRIGKMKVTSVWPPKRSLPRR